MVIKISLNIIDIDQELIEYTLIKSNEDSDTITWSKQEKSPSGENYNLIIKTNIEMNEIIDIVKGNFIANNQEEIKEIFLDALFQLKIEKNEDEFSGIEHDNDSNMNQMKPSLDKKPYDPKKIRIDTRPFGIAYIQGLIASGDLDISPDFQREFVWTDITRKSRLIESLLLRIPLPAFYLAQDQKGCLKVVDGIQRLTVIDSFMKNEFKLKNLEYLEELDGCWFENPAHKSKSLPEMYTRRINQTQLFFNIIDPDTPESVKYDIFKRINTGGKSLNAQEIRNCLSSDKIRKFLKSMVVTEAFKLATRDSISSTRMADKEICLRFIAFYLLDQEISKKDEYKGGMGSFLDETIGLLNSLPESTLDKIQKDFIKAMENAYVLFGNQAFRKTNYINKALFLSLSRVLYKYSENELSLKKEDIVKSFKRELKDNEEYGNSLSMGTNDAKRINLALEVAEKIIKGNNDD